MVASCLRKSSLMSLNSRSRKSKDEWSSANTPILDVQSLNRPNSSCRPLRASEASLWVRSRMPWEKRPRQAFAFSRMVSGLVALDDMANRLTGLYVDSGVAARLPQASWHAWVPGTCRAPGSRAPRPVSFLFPTLVLLLQLLSDLSLHFLYC